MSFLNPSGEGSATRVLLLQSSRSCTSTGVRFRLMRSCEMVFIHLFLCLPRFRRPYTSASRICLTQWSSFRRWTCPYHLSLDSRILSVMQQTPMASRMSSFLFLSFSVIPSIHRSILISVLSRHVRTRTISVRGQTNVITAVQLTCRTTSTLDRYSSTWSDRRCV